MAAIDATKTVASSELDSLGVVTTMRRLKYTSKRQQRARHLYLLGPLAPEVKGRVRLCFGPVIGATW